MLVLTASIFLTVYAEMLALLLLPFYIAATKQSFVFFRRKQDLFFLSAFWVLSLLVTIFSGGTVTDILLGVFMVFAFIAVIFVTYTMTQRAFRLILSFVCIMSPYCLLVALVQRALGMEWVYGARYNSIFTNPNYYAFYISLVVLFCIYTIVKSEDTPLRGLYAALPHHFHGAAHRLPCHAVVLWQEEVAFRVPFHHARHFAHTRLVR